MKILDIILNKKSRFNIAILFIATLFDKLFGFFRELIIAYIFGASATYARYLSLSVFVDAFMVFTGDVALQANIVPRFARLFKIKPDISLHKVRKDAIRFALFFVALNFIVISLFALFSNISGGWLLLATILSFTVGVYIFNSIGLMLWQAKGDYFNYAKGSIIYSSFSALLVWPLSTFFGIIGLAFSRFFSIAFQYFKAWRHENISKSVSNDEVVGMSFKDFSLYTIAAANFYVVIILVAKLLLSFNNEMQITHFNYVTIVFSIIITTIVRSFGTVILQRSAVGFSLKPFMRTLFLVIAISFLAAILMYYFGQDIIRLLFCRGAFKMADVLISTHILKILIIPFILQAVSLILIQPILADQSNIRDVFRKSMTYITLAIVIVVLIISKITKIDTMNIVYFVVYLMSFVIFVAALVAFRLKLNQN